MADAAAKAAIIPSQPTELEDRAAAPFQASVHFVERNVIEKGGTIPTWFRKQ